MKRAGQVVQPKEDELQRLNDEMETCACPHGCFEDKEDPLPAPRTRSAKILGMRRMAHSPPLKIPPDTG